jgi:outer membrane protein assembly factor BamD (BamD/ComL family)
MILANQIDSFDDYSKKIALNWLDDVYKNQSNPYKRAKALYYSSIIYIKQGDLKKAEVKIKRILSEKTLEAGQITDLATISLARIYGAQKNLKQSFETYKSIEKQSSFYKDSLYEQIFILQRMKKYFEASKIANQLLVEYPNDPLSRKVKNSISQLYMMSGQTDKALQSIETQKKYWADLQTWIGKKYTVKAIDAKKLFELNAKINETGIISLPAALKQYAEIFSKIADLKQRAKGNRDEVRNMILNLGRVGYHTYMPEVTGRSTQLKEAVKDLFQIGDQLVSAEIEVYKNKIPSSLKAALEVSFKRRTNLFVPENQFTAQRGSPSQLSRTLELNNRLVKLNERLADLSANLRFYNYINEATKENQGLETDLVADLQQRSREIENSILRGAEIVRSRSILNLQYSNPIRGVKRLMLAGLTQLHGDYTQLYRVRDEYKHVNEKYLAYEIEDIWKKFDYMAVALFDVLHHAENQFNRSILADVKDFERLDAYYAKVVNQLNESERKIQDQLNDNFMNDFADIDRQIVNQIAFQSKLGGDSNWYQFIGEEKKLNEIGAEYINEKGSVIRSSGYIGNEAQ